MKVALVHDYIKEYGGAERVLEALHEIWPDAPVFTSVYLPQYLGPHRQRFTQWDIKTSWFQHVPNNATLISPFRLIAPWVFSRFDFSDFDVVIVSATGAYQSNRITTKKALHVSYTHTPPRYLYGFATARHWRKHLLLNIVGTLMNHILRLIDFQSNQRVDVFIANSHTVAARIQKFYRKEAVVIYPPVEMQNTAGGQSVGSRFAELSESSGKYYVAGGRLTRSKHMDLIVKTCVRYGLPLKVFGKAFAGYGRELEVLSGPSVELVGEVTDEERQELMRHAKAFINAGEDEDFGILPVEAMSCGIPVVAYRSGGVLESVVEGKTGVFFDELSMTSLKKALDELGTHPLKKAECIKQAQKFSKERFQKEMRAFVEKQVRLYNTKR